MPSRSFVRPYNALVAVRRTRSFHASVTFDPDTEVDAVWSYDGVPPLSIEDGVPTDRMLDLGTGRSVAADWPIVRQGLAYGIGWS